MKKLLIILFIMAVGMGKAQEKLKVEYKVTPFYEDPNPIPGMEMNARSTYFDLILDKDESQFDMVERIDNTQTDVAAGGMSATFFISSNGTLYKNTATGEMIEEQKLGEKRVLVKGELEKFDWTITKETKTVEEIEVQKATTILDDEYKTKVTAWYAPKLNFKTGPDKYWGLPGLILEVQTLIEHESGSRESTTYTAQKVETLKSNKAIHVPTKGKEMTKEGFEKEQKEMWEKQMEMYKGGVDKD